MREQHIITQNHSEVVADPLNGTTVRSLLADSKGLTINFHQLQPFVQAALGYLDEQITWQEAWEKQSEDSHDVAVKTFEDGKVVITQQAKEEVTSIDTAARVFASDFRRDQEREFEKSKKHLRKEHDDQLTEEEKKAKTFDEKIVSAVRQIDNTLADIVYSRRDALHTGDLARAYYKGEEASKNVKARGETIQNEIESFSTMPEAWINTNTASTKGELVKIDATKPGKKPELLRKEEEKAQALAGLITASKFAGKIITEEVITDESYTEKECKTVGEIGNQIREFWKLCERYKVEDFRDPVQVAEFLRLFETVLNFRRSQLEQLRTNVTLISEKNKEAITKEYEAKLAAAETMHTQKMQTHWTETRTNAEASSKAVQEQYSQQINYADFAISALKHHKSVEGNELAENRESMETTRKYIGETMSRLLEMQVVIQQTMPEHETTEAMVKYLQTEEQKIDEYLANLSEKNELSQTERNEQKEQLSLAKAALHAELIKRQKDFDEMARSLNGTVAERDMSLNGLLAAVRKASTESAFTVEEVRTDNIEDIIAQYRAYQAEQANNARYDLSKHAADLGRKGTESLRKITIFALGAKQWFIQKWSLVTGTGTSNQKALTTGATEQ